jgi:putative inorganic carbon (hco3(-)) transporter
MRSPSGWLARWKLAIERVTRWPLRLQGAARRWGWLLLLALAPLFLFMSPATSPALLVVPAMLAVLWTKSEPAVASRTPLDWALLLLAVMLLVSLWATFSIAFSLPKIAGLVFGLGLFYSVVARGRAAPGGWGEVAAVYLALGAGVAAVGLLGTRWSAKIPVLTAIAARLPADLITLPGAENGLQPNEVAGVLVWVAPVAVALAGAVWLNFDVLAESHGRAHITAAGVLLTFVALGTAGVLVLTQSRSGLLGLAAALLTMVSLGWWARPGSHLAAPVPGRRPIWLIGSVTALALMVGVGFLFRQPIAAASRQFLAPAASGPASDDALNTLDARVEIWSRAIYGIEDFPFTGMGLNTFRKLVNVLYPLFTISPDIDIAHAHNTWLQVALDLGLPGLVAYLGVWLATLVMLFQSLRRSAPVAPLLWALALGLLGALAGSFGYGLTDTVALGARPGFLWWMLLALAVLVWMQSQPAGVYSLSQSVPQNI